jgi:EAL domain-containing protein (putative c-di-GMP-specific phosphodiesterase class I)
VEALVRWQHPQKGLLPPGVFVGLAEETGLVIPLGEQILRIACEQSVAWEKEGYKDISMAVNFSAKQFNKKDIMDDIARIIEETGMRPDLLDIEITESIAMENLDNTIMIMNHLKEKQIKFSLDDFGTGYSSLNYLNNLPINHLKIDKQFIQNIQRGSFEEVVVKAIIDIAHNMSLVVIAEGVETKEQYETLTEFQGDLAQGYYISKPVPNAVIEEMLQKQLARMM